MTKKYRTVKTGLKGLIFLLLAGCSFACQPSRQKPAENPDTDFKLHKAVVRTVQKAGEKTYLNVEEKGNLYWLVVPGRELKTGDQFFYSQANVSKQYRVFDEELGQSFDSVLYVSDATVRSEHETGTRTETMPQKSMPHGHGGGKVAPVRKNVSVEPRRDGVSISELYRNKARYAGKKIRVRGEVVKVNANIMQRNWVHLQDGTSYSGDFDLTITTQDVVTTGEQVTFEGTISLDRDFTSGYFYPVIMEDAGKID